MVSVFLNSVVFLNTIILSFTQCLSKSSAYSALEHLSLLPLNHVFLNIPLKFLAPLKTKSCYQPLNVDIYIKKQCKTHYMEKFTHSDDVYIDIFSILDLIQTFKLGSRITNCLLNITLHLLKFLQLNIHKIKHLIYPPS